MSNLTVDGPRGGGRYQPGCNCELLIAYSLIDGVSNRIRIRVTDMEGGLMALSVNSVVLMLLWVGFFHFT